MTDLQTTELDTAIREVLAETFGLDAAAIPVTTSSQDVAAWDSLGHIGLVMALEQRFGVAIDVAHIAGMQSFVRIREVLGELAG